MGGHQNYNFWSPSPTDATVYIPNLVKISSVVSEEKNPNPIPK